MTVHSIDLTPYELHFVSVTNQTLVRGADLLPFRFLLIMPHLQPQILSCFIGVVVKMEVGKL